MAGVGAGGAKGKSYGTIRLPFTPLEAQAGGHPAAGRIPVPGVQAVRKTQAGHHGAPHPPRGRVSGACLYRRQPGEFMQHLSPESPSRERSERNCFKIPISVLSRGVLGKETGAGKDIAEGIMTNSFGILFFLSRGGRTDKNGMRAVGLVIPPPPARLPAALGDRRGELFPTPGEFWTKGVRQ